MRCFTEEAASFGHCELVDNVGCSRIAIIAVVDYS
jgi:hypothetical protein